jgi:GDP-D-mannose 3', 5'-epimerase
LSTKVRSLVTGAGGFIGRHLVSFLRAQGHWVRGVDLSPPEFCDSDANEYELLDLRRFEDCVQATGNIDEMYALAADVGRPGCDTPDHAQIFHNNRLINLHCIEAARKNRVTRYLFASSTSVYPELCENTTNNVPLNEEDAYQGTPEDASGWANCITERLCIHYRQAYGLETRIVRLPDVFGPVGPWLGGRESAPAELCRKIAAAQLEALNEIEISGDGEQKVSLCYIDDCVKGIFKVLRSDCFEPLNLCEDRMVSINELADMIANIAGVRVNKTHVPGSQAVRGRNSDNTRLKEVLRWAPQTSLEEGLRRTYLWVEKQVRELASEYSFGIATFPLLSDKES